MTESDNIEIITRFEHAFRAADQATIDELCDPGVVDHNPAPGHEPTLAGFKQKVAGFKALFPDLVEDLQDIIASGDTVATRWVLTASLQQEYMGIPATGQTIRIEGMMMPVRRALPSERRGSLTGVDGRVSSLLPRSRAMSSGRMPRAIMAMRWSAFIRTEWAWLRTPATMATAPTSRAVMGIIKGLKNAVCMGNLLFCRA